MKSSGLSTILGRFWITWTCFGTCTCCTFRWEFEEHEKRAAAEGSPAGGSTWAKVTVKVCMNPGGLAALVSVTGPTSAAGRNSHSRSGIHSRAEHQRSAAQQSEVSNPAGVCVQGRVEDRCCMAKR